MDLKDLVWSVVKPGALWEWLASPSPDPPLAADLLCKSFAVRARSESAAAAVPAQLRSHGDADPLTLRTAVNTSFLYIPQYFCDAYVLGLCFIDSIESWVRMLPNYADTGGKQPWEEAPASYCHLARFVLNLNNGNEFFTLFPLPGDYTALIVVRYDLDGEIEMNKILLDAPAAPGAVPTRIITIVRAVSSCKRCLLEHGAAGHSQSLARAVQEACNCPEAARAGSFSPTEVCVPSYAEFVRRAARMEPRGQKMQLLSARSMEIVRDLGVRQVHDYYFSEGRELRLVREKYSDYAAGLCLDPFPDMLWLGDFPSVRERQHACQEDEEALCGALALPDADRHETSSADAVSEAPPARPRKRPRVACAECGATFSKTNNLRRHVATIHDGTRAFSCTECDPEVHFSQRIHLQRHMAALHSGTREHACEDCGQTFAIKNNLSRHRKAVHLNIKPFACARCPAAFADRSDLRKHCARRHPGLPPPT